MELEGPRWWPGLTLHHRLMLKARKSDAPRKVVAWQGSHGDLVAKPWGSPTVGRGLGSMPALRSAHAHRCPRQPVPVPGMRTMGRGGYVLCALKTLSVPACHSPREELLWRELCGCPASGKFFSCRDRRQCRLIQDLAGSRFSTRGSGCRRLAQAQRGYQEQSARGPQAAGLARPLRSELGALAKWTDVCFSISRKLKIKIDTCKMRLSGELRTTGNCNLSSGCCDSPERSPEQAPFATHTVRILSFLSSDHLWLIK